MSTEVENQEQQKELSSGLNEAIGEISSCWPQSGSTDGKMETGDSGSVKSASSGVGNVPPFSKDDDKSSTESLGSGGGIWGQKVGMPPESAWPGHGGIDWSVSNEANKDGSKGYPWSSSTMQEGHGTTNALGLSVDFWKPSMLGGYGSSTGSNGWGESRVNSWGAPVPDSKTEFNKEGLPDKRIGLGDQERAKGLWGGGPEERKVEPIGPVQRRSASLTELNVTFDSLSLGTEPVKFPSTGKMGLNDERSQPDGAEVSQQNREELIMKMINSNEGWGKKPIIQETPWNMDTVAVPPVAEPLPPAATEETAAAKNDSVFWNVPKESSNSGWNSNPTPAPATYEWAPDSDIGMWNGPPPPESVNPNMWTGPPKEPSPVWAGSQGGMAQVGADKGMLSSGAIGWGDRGFHGSGMDKMQKEFGRDGGGGIDRARGTDSWAQQPPRGTFDNNWTSTEVNTWSLPHPADQQQHDNWGMGKQPMNNFPSSGFGLGGKPEPISKIGTWGEAATATETGLWNQQQPLSNMQNPLQQLMDLGLKKEDAASICLQNNMSADKILELMRMQKDNEPPKGRIIRGKSMVEMPNNDQFGHFQGNRNSGFQAGGRGGSMYQSSVPGNMPPQMHMKSSGMQQSGGGGWPGMGGQQVYGRTPSMPMGNTSLMQPVPQMNPMMHQTLLQLQSLLQPLLQQRAQIQHNRNMTPMQKAVQIEQLNIQISEVKRHIDQVQLLFGPPPGTIAPSTMNSVPDQQLGGGLDEAAKMMQLLGLKQNRDFGGLSHPPLGSVNEMPMVDNKTSMGGMPNLSMDQMAAFMGSNRWPLDQSGGFQMMGKDKLPGGDMLVDSFANLGQSGGAGSKMGWPGVPGDFGAPKGSRPPPPPGLDKADMFYNRSTSWAPGEKLKSSLPGQGGIPSSWLMLKNVSSTLDPGMLQKMCLLYGPLQNFYYSKVSGQALACYINRDDALTALSNISQNVHSSGPSTRIIAELVAAEDIGRVIDNSWTAIPPSFGSAPSGAKPNPMRGSSSGWDGM